MKQAIIFPGQGSQFVGMGKALAENFSIARQVFEEVDDILNYKLSEIMFEGPMETLTLTTHTQPALMTLSYALMQTIHQETGKDVAELCSYVAGHSLGEYTALAVAGAISLADTARLLKIRGEAMQSAVPIGEGKMIALLGATIEEAGVIAEKAGGLGFCEIANDNAPGQIVLSGTTAGIERAMAMAAELSKRAILLPVSAPFHSSLMQPAALRMHAALAEVNIQQPVVPVVTNCTAMATQDPEIIRRLLVEQVTGQVRWRESILQLAAYGVTHAVEVGAGKVLSGMIKRIAPEMTTASIQDMADLPMVLEALHVLHD